MKFLGFNNKKFFENNFLNQISAIRWLFKKPKYDFVPVKDPNVTFAYLSTPSQDHCASGSASIQRQKSKNWYKQRIDELIKFYQKQKVCDLNVLDEFYGCI